MTTDFPIVLPVSVRILLKFPTALMICLYLISALSVLLYIFYSSIVWNTHFEIGVSSK